MIETNLKMPETVQIEITRQCNLRCRMCRRNDSAILPESVGHMKMSTWRRTLEIVPDISYVGLVGFGEPVLHPQFGKMLRELDAEGVPFSFSTNGIAITSRDVEQWSSLEHLASINVSIDSPDSAVYENVRGGSLQKATAGLSILVQGLPFRVVLNVSSVVMMSNIQSLYAFPDLLAEWGVTSFLLQDLHETTSLSDGERPSEKEREQLFAHVRSACAHHGMCLTIHDFGAQLAEDVSEPDMTNSLFPVNRTRNCLAPWDTPYIDKNGDVFPCCLADKNSVMGNVVDTDFDEIWVGQRFRTFRKNLMNGDLLEMCRRCMVAPLDIHSRHFSADINFARSRLRGWRRVELVVKNTGSLPWTREKPLEVVTHNDLLSSHTHIGTWRSGNRVCYMQDDLVEPWEETVIIFFVTPSYPAKPEKFQLVAPGDKLFHRLPGTLFEIESPLRWMIIPLRRLLRATLPSPIRRWLGEKWIRFLQRPERQ